MKKLLATTALVLSLATSGVAIANEGPGGRGHHDAMLQETLSSLPKEKADAFRATLKESHEKNKGSREQGKALKDELRTIASAPKFDKAAYIAKSKELQNLHEKNHASRTEAFASALAKLTPEERKTVVDAMEERREAMHEKRVKRAKAAGELTPSATTPEQ